MNETKKLVSYRQKEGYHRFFRGRVIDIGCGRDVLSKTDFPSIDTVVPYDRFWNQKHDAEACIEFEDCSFDTVYSSHCLEHLNHPESAFSHWIRICKPLGFIVFAVPHEIFYEKCRWPSPFNPEHKTSWSNEFKSNLPCPVNINEFLASFKQRIRIEFVKTLLFDFDFQKFVLDQTLKSAVCQIECVVQKTDV